MDSSCDQNRIDRTHDFAGETFETGALLRRIDSGLASPRRPPNEDVNGTEREALQAAGAEIEVNRYSGPVYAEG